MDPLLIYKSSAVLSTCATNEMQLIQNDTHHNIYGYIMHRIGSFRVIFVCAVYLNISARSWIIPCLWKYFNPQPPIHKKKSEWLFRQGIIRYERYSYIAISFCSMCAMHFDMWCVFSMYVFYVELTPHRTMTFVLYWIGLLNYPVINDNKLLDLGFSKCRFL